MKFYLHEKGGGGGGGAAEKVSAMLKGGQKKFWGSIYSVAGSFSHIVEGARKVSTL